MEMKKRKIKLGRAASNNEEIRFYLNNQYVKVCYINEGNTIDLSWEKEETTNKKTGKVNINPKLILLTISLKILKLTFIFFTLFLSAMLFIELSFYLHFLFSLSLAPLFLIC